MRPENWPCPETAKVAWDLKWMQRALSHTWNASRSRRPRGFGLAHACSECVARRCPSWVQKLLPRCCALRPRSASPSCPQTRAAVREGQGTRDVGRWEDSAADPFCVSGVSIIGHALKIPRLLVSLNHTLLI